MLIMINVVVFLIMLFSDWGLMDDRFTVDVFDRFAMVPQDIISGDRLYTLFSSIFLHAGIFHLFGNMVYLYIFGDNVEGVFGHLSYVVFYVVCGLAAGVVHIVSITDPNLFVMPVVGASGAISGILGAYLVLYPKARILTLLFPVIVPLPAIIFLGFWFFMQWLYVAFGVGGTVAYWAHIGGFVTGLVLALTFGRERKRVREARFRL
jgi:membrane associated rhomboid family serine protease